MRKKALSVQLLILIGIIVGLSVGWISLSVKADLIHELGGLYAGTANPGVVYKYEGGTQWNPISPTGEPEDVISESINIESLHPYPNDYDNAWTITRSGVAVMRAHFSYIRTESYCDYVYIKDTVETSA